ncbi:MAG: hypothetical protein LPK19_10565, partial [Hymenobacteraceae bacterium]|nr:hypothetical protein [Hymenobacteraceae bacterium]MDX5396674.1 hypothetical protein [Hymenobacteraceae bacterium]MDX5512737.1 hypothetical protein [Hymenobacteraceae bacterium]
IDLNKNVFAGFLQTLSGSNLNRDYILSKLKLYLDQHQNELVPLSQLVTEFNTLLPLKQEEILPAAAPAPTPAPAPVTAQAPATPPKAAPAPQPVMPKPQHHPEPVSTQVAPQPRPEPVTATRPAAAPAEANLNERFKAERSTLNEIFKKPAPATLADNMGNKKIDSLKNSISINQRISFINELFDGDNMAYHAAIKVLDEFDSAEAAKTHLLQDIGSKHDWSRKDEHVQKLLRLIDRKFI